MNPNALKDASGNSTGIRFDFGEDYTKIDGSVNGGVFSEYNGFLGYGARIFDGTEYAICGGGGEYYRMIRGINANCGNSDKPDKEIPTGRYLVRLIGMDVNGNDIPVYNATGEADRKLVTQEFEVIVVDDTQANMVTKVEALAKDSEGLDLDDKLAVKFGNPIVNIDFDQYRYLTLTDSKSGVSDLTDYFNTKDGDKTNINFKWPEKWSDVTYGYGYDVKNYEMSGSGGKYGTYSFNYNIYLIANNTSMIPYATANGNLNDITYYKTKNTEEPTSGFFFWVNVASDPGIAAKLKIDKLCTGSTIHVSAYMAEVSNPIKSETANVAFNFVAVSAKGERKTIHTFVSGYVPNPGDWYRVYYQFMPDFNIIKDINDDPDFDIDHFEIELENNCKNSESADYAIDEISVYIVRPSVEAEQIDLICEDAVESVDVKISMPFEPLMASIGVAEATESDSPDAEQQDMVKSSPYYSSLLRETRAAEDISIYYCFVDKEVLYKYYRSKGYVEAFKEALLQYNYDTSNEDPQFFGKLSFSNVYEKNEAFPNPMIGEDGNKLYRLIRHIRN